MNRMIFLKNLELDNKKIVLIVLVGLIVFYMDFSFILKSQLKNIKDIGPKIAKLKNDMDNLSRDLAGMQDLKSRRAKAGEGLAVRKAKRIISEEEVASLLENISEIGNKNNIKIMQIKPSKELKNKEVAPDKDASESMPLSIDLDLVCGYHKFGSFLNDIENAPELMAVEGIRIEPDPTNYLQQRVHLVLRTYVKK